MPHDLMHQYGMFYTKAIADTHLAKLAISSGYKDIDDATISKAFKRLLEKLWVFREFGVFSFEPLTLKIVY